MHDSNTIDRVINDAAETVSHRLAPGAHVVVGMSGGVDSSVAALLLQHAGYRVSGLFMKNWEEDDGTEYCTAIADHADASAVCERLGIELHTANFAAEYWDNVFEAFLCDYRDGFTPNPDVLCNREIKFRHFEQYARVLGADAIATGHYARCEPGANGPVLLKGRDPAKDQSYFLQAVPRAALRDVLFPLGDLHKPQVRAIAEHAGFTVHDKKDSTGICFIGERRFADFMRRYVPEAPGEIVAPDGQVLGTHRGLAYYTRGQRQGLGVGGRAGRSEAPWYVVEKALASQRLLVSQDERDLLDDQLTGVDVNWLAATPELPLRCTAKIRYRQPDQACRVSRIGKNTIQVNFAAAQRAIAPGQFVAFYDGDRLLGGARITAYGTHSDGRVRDCA